MLLLGSGFLARKHCLKYFRGFFPPYFFYGFTPRCVKDFMVVCKMKNYLGNNALVVTSVLLAVTSIGWVLNLSSIFNTEVVGFSVGGIASDAG